METLPDNFAISLGHILFNGGRIEMLLDRFLARAGEQPPRRGLSGAQLVKELRKVASPGSRLSGIVDGYEAVHEWRNHLVHGAHTYANGVLWTWREPAKANGNAAFSFQFTLDDLEDTSQSWQRLADAAHDELHLRITATADQ